MSGQGWEDIVLPLFDQPEPEPERPMSAKEADDHENKISYQRYKGVTAACRDCYHAGAYSPAAFIRTAGDDQRPLCYRCRYERGEAEELAVPRGG